MRNSKYKPLLLGIFIALLLLGGLVLVFNNAENNPTETSELTLSNPSFGWRFAEADTLNLDGLPQTHIFLTTTYDDGTSEEELVDTVDGGCSELSEEQYEGDISNTGKVQCYYAGLGQQYRISKNQKEYVVERKIFEEALPETIIIDNEWEVIFTLSS